MRENEPEHPLQNGGDEQPNEVEGVFIDENGGLAYWEDVILDFYGTQIIMRIKRKIQ